MVLVDIGFIGCGVGGVLLSRYIDSLCRLFFVRYCVFRCMIGYILLNVEFCGVMLMLKNVCRLVFV